MLIKVDTEKLSKLIKNFDEEWLLCHMAQNIDIIDIINSDDLLKSNIHDLAAFINCMEAIKEEA